MSTPSSAAIIAASRDSDLLARAVASVYEYADAQPRYRTGQDPASVTDTQIVAALRTIDPQ